MQAQTKKSLYGDTIGSRLFLAGVGLIFLLGGSAGYTVLDLSLRRAATGGLISVWAIIFVGALVLTALCGAYFALTVRRRQIRITRLTEVLLDFSRAMPVHPVLDDLLTFVVDSIKLQVEVESVSVMMWDRARDEIFFRVAQTQTEETSRRLREIRFPADHGLAGFVIQTGESVMINDVSKDPRFYQGVDDESGFKTKSILYVPLKVQGEPIGVLGVLNKIHDKFNQDDLDLLTMLSTPVALALENARVNEQLQLSYEEVQALNTAKTKMINHLSHELKTPLAVIASSVSLLGRGRYRTNEEKVDRLLIRTQRQVDRLVALSEEAGDIAVDRSEEDRNHFAEARQSLKDFALNLAEKYNLPDQTIDRLVDDLDKALDPTAPLPPQRIDLSRWVEKLIEQTKPLISRRSMEINASLAADAFIDTPQDVLSKAASGILRNAVEYTPDGGTIDVSTTVDGPCVRLTVADHGVGMSPETQAHVFHGFIHAGDTADYSSGQAYDFGAGGGGADLLRIKLFSERYGFNLLFTSRLCEFLDRADQCPGNAADCPHCTEPADCRASGGSSFTLEFCRSENQ